MRTLEHKVPPPVVALLTGLAMWAVAHRTPVLAVHAGPRLAIAAALAMFGLCIEISGVLAFRRARTTVNPMKPATASAMVTGGVYRYTRNPMYAGLATVLLGWAVWLAAPWGLLGPAAFIAFITRFQIIPEERALRARFGSEYEGYLLRVRRW